jgi:hypothetical protein
MDPITLMMLLQGGGNLLGSGLNALGSFMASGAQRDAAQQAMGVQRDIWGQQQQNQAPYLQAGQSTLADLLRQMQGGAFEVDGSTLQNDPGYQFRLAEGQKALERSAAARGGLNSGATLKSLARYSQGVASDELQNAWQRRQGAFGRLASIAGMGQSAANSLGQMGGQYANNMSNLYGAMGNANAAGWMGLTNAGADAIGSASTLGGLAAGGGFGGGGGAVPPNSPGGMGGQGAMMGSFLLPTQNGRR